MPTLDVPPEVAALNHAIKDAIQAQIKGTREQQTATMAAFHAAVEAFPQENRAGVLRNGYKRISIVVNKLQYGEQIDRERRDEERTRDAIDYLYDRVEEQKRSR